MSPVLAFFARCPRTHPECTMVSRLHQPLCPRGFCVSVVRFAVLSALTLGCVSEITTPDAFVPMDVSGSTDVPLAMDAAGCGMSPTLPADSDPWAVDFSSVGPAVTRVVTSGGHRDVYLSGPGGIAAFAVRLHWGGSVAFFGRAGRAGSNTLEANDTGRELQLARY